MEHRRASISRDRPAARSDESNMLTKTSTKKRSTKRTTKSHKPAAKAKSSGSTERRASERTELVANATLYTEVSPDVAHKVWLTNLSLGGVQFKTRRVYEAGQCFHIKLEAGPIDMDCPIRIVWTRNSSDGLYYVGCEFLPD
jgi:hypothetical protein